MISCSWLAATSACAETRSSGGDCPTSTFALLTRTSSSASVERGPPRVDVRPRRDQIPVRRLHAAVVWTRLSRSRVSAMSRLVWLIASC